MISIERRDSRIVIDTPQLPTKAVQMRKDAEQHGPIRYVINTEHHVDHIFGNYYFKGGPTVVHHQGVYDNFMVVGPELDPFAYAKEALPTDDPEGEAIFPERDVYYEDPNKGSVVFTGDLTLRVGQRVWQQVEDFTLSSAEDHHYMAQLDEEGVLEVTFGDGRNGRRLPTGIDNVRVRYRTGYGEEGNLAPNALVKIAKPHALVEDFVAPLETSGGAEKETSASMRETAAPRRSSAQRLPSS